MGECVAANSYARGGWRERRLETSRQAPLFQFNSSSMELLPGVTLVSNSHQLLFHFANSNASFSGTELRQDASLDFFIRNE
jgi:hypothetical protein